MITVTKVQMKCEECGYKFGATKKEGGFWHRLSYTPNRCPDCGSKDVREYSGFIEAVLKTILGS